ncbi:armadillo-type protein [Gymnopilus junonius]|uniref:Armadillo-type protein n=1 Tax=Gymnopilus junonius TaxID=109634 RepID=A0A9P5P2C6_GYMJU|nr:armadillo-type protein [Gymnopilus junonius]
MTALDSNANTDFKKLKAICVPLLGTSRLTPAAQQILSEIPSENLTSNLISYVFLPLSTILQRNPSSEIPNQILEKIFIALSFFARVWEQIFMLSGAVIGGIDEKSGRKRDDETKDAAARCLISLLRPPLQKDAQNPKFVPVVGQTLDSVLNATFSFHLSLQRAVLEVTYILIDLYLPDRLVPSVLPGVVSTMTKICWANGEIVARGLQVMQVVVTRAIGNEVCIRDGAIRRIDTLEDLVGSQSQAEPSTADKQLPYGTVRTESWLRGTATQLHIAINSISSLQSHPTPFALQSLADFSATLLRSTSLTLPQTQSLLLSFLLSLSLSEYRSHLLLHPSDAQLSLQYTVMKNLGDNLSALPRLLSTHADSRVTHAASLITAVCRLASGVDAEGSLVVAKGIRKLLGSTGGIEKWGWGLLSVLEIVEPPVITPEWIEFPDLIFNNISSQETRDALKNMFHALGLAGGDSCLFAVEWFLRVGRSGISSTSVAALWCACRLLEGIAQISLYSGRAASLSSSKASKRLEKEARALAKSIAEIWDRPDDILDDEIPLPVDDERSFFVQHQKGIIPLDETLRIVQPSKPKESSTKHQPIVHRALCLQLIAISAGVSQARFAPLFIHILYPVLHSLVSPLSFLSSTALATLNFITIATSYASPANLLLSNFDYVLDSVSRRLTRRWLDIDATKVLAIMIRLVGPDIVDRAGDVVEECFDRLDEYHGYGIIVDGLIEVLMEVLKVIELEARQNKRESKAQPPSAVKVSLDNFLSFLPKRSETKEADNTDYGPAPRGPWGEDKSGEDKIDEEEGFSKARPDQADEPPPTTVQALTKQIISRSLYFLTHESPVIRTRILNLLALSIPVLPESALLPSIHSAWPFILNRLADSETFVVSAAAALVEELAKHVGEFMFRRVWDDVWPKFRSMLRALEGGEATSALTRRGKTGIGTESAYTHSHRLYRSILRTMTFALQGVHEHETSFWEIIVTFRRFLAAAAHEELQQCAVALYVQAGKVNPDSVWLVLSSTVKEMDPVMAFLKKDWDIGKNVGLVLKNVD